MKKSQKISPITRESWEFFFWPLVNWIFRFCHYYDCRCLPYEPRHSGLFLCGRCSRNLLCWEAVLRNPLFALYLTHSLYTEVVMRTLWVRLSISFNNNMALDLAQLSEKNMVLDNDTHIFLYSQGDIRHALLDNFVSYIVSPIIPSCVWSPTNVYYILNKKDSSISHFIMMANEICRNSLVEVPGTMFRIIDWILCYTLHSNH